ncbi:unnamed protein product [Linum trigynum]|uniref:Secreted protein n=1 Tax=Linum trigynum TaxID=586398 RepID=A0AAV2FZ12_9ROSI
MNRNLFIRLLMVIVGQSSSPPGVVVIIAGGARGLGRRWLCIHFVMAGRDGGGGCSRDLFPTLVVKRWRCLSWELRRARFRRTRL